MRVTLLGATGATGALLLPLLERDHDVTVLARRPDRVAAGSPGTRLRRGDATDPAAVRDAVAAAEAVVTLVAAPRGEAPGTVRSQATGVLLSAAREAAPGAHLVLVSALGGAASAGQLSWFGRMIYAAAVGRERLAEVDRQERLVTGATLPATLVRPPKLDDGPATGALEVTGRVGASQSLHRADLAAFLADVVRHRPSGPRAVTVVSKR
ncbi:NAD(P)-dependent oxidoreductase [Planomonospora sp. ID82291]|uniref:NAD(P)-dependent oxidoreductase n=1 Tax=Planomonospora sp. ID82291 TaxID=2738136 RepID=UPI0018C37CB2|nr:NAD(P)H-binding protein [Planomonospora sp. ID82291]MBG0814591.1 NAD(P)H-binding protein [Planomonospora sp. ID82291]